MCYTIGMKQLMLSLILGQALLGFLASKPLFIAAKEETIPMSIAVTACAGHQEHADDHRVTQAEKDCFSDEQCILQTEVPVFERMARASEIAPVVIKGFANRAKPVLEIHKFIQTAFIEPSPHHSVILRV